MACTEVDVGLWRETHRGFPRLGMSTHWFVLEICTNKRQHGFLKRKYIRQGEEAISGGEEESEQKKNRKNERV